MAAKWKKILGAIAPTIGTALGGPLGGLAVSVAAEALGLPQEATERDLKKAVEGMTPEQYERLHAADATYKTRLAELEVEEEKIHAGDRASARQMRMKSTRWTADMIAIVIVFGFFGVFALMFFYGDNISDNSKELLYIMAGGLTTLLASIAQFFFGSSAGSKSKTDIMSKMNGADK